MEIVNKLDYVFTDEWFEPFIKQVLTKAGLNCDKVYLVDIEPYKRFYLDIDDCEYTIRAWNYFAMDHDRYGRTCAEDVDYTLFKQNGNVSDKIDEGYCRIEWENTPPCDARIMQILEEHKQMTRGKLRQRILDEGYGKLAFRKVIRTLLQTKLTAEGDARSLNQIISLRREEDKKYAN